MRGSCLCSESMNVRSAHLRSGPISFFDSSWQPEILEAAASRSSFTVAGEDKCLDGHEGVCPGGGVHLSRFLAVASRTRPASEEPLRRSLVEMLGANGWKELLYSHSRVWGRSTSPEGLSPVSGADVSLLEDEDRLKVGVGPT